MGKFVDLTAKKMGKLIPFSWFIKNHRTHWLCKCDCGNLTTVQSSLLLNGHTRSCGCLKERNITGQKFGRWMVHKRTELKSNGDYYWECECECGTRKNILGSTLKQGHSKSCGCLHYDIMRSKRGPQSAHWKGGRIVTSYGYVRVYSPNHPFSRDGYVFEHRLIMEKRIGRYLTHNESVHHKNGIKNDNRDENLELKIRYHGSGQNLIDRLKDAMRLLAQYPDETQAIRMEEHGNSLAVKKLTDKIDLVMEVKAS